VLTHASIVCGGMLASVNSVKNVHRQNCNVTITIDDVHTALKKLTADKPNLPLGTGNRKKQVVKVT